MLNLAKMSLLLHVIMPLGWSDIPNFRVQSPILNYCPYRANAPAFVPEKLFCPQKLWFCFSNTLCEKVCFAMELLRWMQISERFSALILYDSRCETEEPTSTEYVIFYTLWEEQSIFAHTKHSNTVASANVCSWNSYQKGMKLKQL